MKSRSPVRPTLHGLPGPPSPEQTEHLLEHLAAPRAVEFESLPLLSGLAEAGDEAEQQPAAGELIELRQRLGQQERVASERDQVAWPTAKRIFIG